MIAEIKKSAEAKMQKTLESHTGRAAMGKDHGAENRKSDS